MAGRVHRVICRIAEAVTRQCNSGIVRGVHGTAGIIYYESEVRDMVGFYGNYSGYGSMYGSSGSGFMNSFYSNLSQYSSIRTGAYAKAAKAYYGKNGVISKNNVSSNNKVNSKDDTDNSVNKSSSTTTSAAYSRINKENAALTSVKTEAKELVDDVKKLTSTSKDSVFAKDKEYNKDDAYKAVNDFVKSYNDTVTSLKGTSNTAVKNAGDSMSRMTNVMKSSLEKIGITVGKDGKLSVDEETFKKADADKVKGVFTGSGSFGNIISSSASRLEQQADKQISSYNNSNYNNNTYNNKGSYYNYYNSGFVYDGFF